MTHVIGFKPTLLTLLNCEQPFVPSTLLPPSFENSGGKSRASSKLKALTVGKKGRVKYIQLSLVKKPAK
jgi:hypothetical protein